jgi:hypothetical protein
MSVQAPSFSAEDIETITRMWLAGAPASEIGTVLGKSRKSVSGKVRRLKLVRTVKPTVTSSPNFGDMATNLAEGRVRPPQSFTLSAQPLTPTAVPFLESTRTHCRCVLDERGADGFALFCGAPRQAGSSYCPDHHSQFHQTMKEYIYGKTGHAK